MVPVGFPVMSDRDPRDRRMPISGRCGGPAAGKARLEVRRPYSDGFATARPQLVDTGIAGMQRPQGWPDTGVITENEFNLLRSMRVPEGRPHTWGRAWPRTPPT
jgi:hypothetical protein